MNIKRLFGLMALVALTTIPVGAETFTEVEEVQETQQKTVEIPAWINNIKFSGYGMLQYQGQDPEGNHSNSFNLRLARFILDGKIGDFDWRAQIQGTNATGPGQPTVQLVDLYAEWRKYPEFKVRVGQFKRAFTYENPTHPITQGWRGYADVINNLSGFGDRTGEKSSGGRDIGLQVSGDILPNASGRKLLHYQIGVYNGEGINSKDKDNQKDIIGGFWVMPIKGLRIGAFGWTGTRGELSTFYMDLKDVVDQGATMKKLEKVSTTILSARKNRYALSAEYDKDEYTFRAEYIHSQGLGSNLDLGDKADGWYVFGIVPVIKSKLHAKARYQCYRKNKEWNSQVITDSYGSTYTFGGAKTSYEAGLNYFFKKNLEMHFEYARINDRSLEGKHDYNLVTCELDFRF